MGGFRLALAISVADTKPRDMDTIWRMLFVGDDGKPSDAGVKAANAHLERIGAVRCAEYWSNKDTNSAQTDNADADKNTYSGVMSLWFVLINIHQMLISSKLLNQYFPKKEKENFSVGHIAKLLSDKTKIIIPSSDENMADTIRDCLIDIDKFLFEKASKTRFYTKFIEMPFSQNTIYSYFLDDGFAKSIKNRMAEIIKIWTIQTYKVAIDLESINNTLFSTEFSGPEAVQNLRAALVSLVKGDNESDAQEKIDSIGLSDDEPGWLNKPIPVSETPIELYVAGEGDARAEMLTSVTKQLFAAESDTQIVNIYSPHMQGGLTALASELFKPIHRKKHDCTTPMLYIPLHGRAGGDGDSFPHIVSRIAEFYAKITKPSVPPVNLGPPESLDDLFARLQFIRLAMAEKAAILIFDGYTPFRLDEKGTLAAMLAVISDDWLFDMLAVLVTPPTPKVGEDKGQYEVKAFDVDRFRKNRFVILSDADLLAVNDDKKDILFSICQCSSKEFPKIHRSFHEKEDTIGLIRTDEMRDWNKHLLFHDAVGDKIDDIGPIHDDIKLKTKKAIQIDLDQNEGKDISEGSVNLFAAMRALGSGRDMLANCASETDIADALAGCFPKEGSPQHWKPMLMLIAIAPGGLRPKTLVRAYTHYLELMDNTFKSTPEFRSELNETVRIMVLSLAGLIGLYQSDGIEVLSEKSLPLRYGGQPETDGEIKTDRVIRFTFETIRIAFLKELENDRPQSSHAPDGLSKMRHYLHFVLAKEALEQHILISRFDPRQMEGALRRHRRLLTGIYHGLASLTDGVPDNTGWRFPITLRQSVLPVDELERWVRLYALFYEHILNQNTTSATVRFYAADVVHHDVMCAFRWPALCLNGVGQKPDFSTYSEDNVKNYGKKYAQLRTLFEEFGGQFDQSRRAIGKQPERETGGIVANTDDDGQNTAINLTNYYYDIMREIGRYKRLNSLAGHYKSKYLLKHARSKNTDFRIRSLQYLGLIVGTFADWQIYFDQEDENSVKNIVKKRFRQSYRLFDRADTLRRTYYINNPLEQKWLIQPEAAKGFIRVSLKLFRLEPEKVAYLEKARAIADGFALHYSQSPRDRAGMLIIESMLARYSVPVDDNEYRRHLLMALECLQQAEPLVLRMSGHSRLRQRFLLERHKVLLALAMSEEASVKNQLIRLAEQDLNGLKAITERISVTKGLWNGIYLRLKEKFNTLS